MTSSASLAVVTPMKPMPSGLSRERAAALRPFTNSRSTRCSSLMTRMRLSGFMPQAGPFVVLTIMMNGRRRGLQADRVRDPGAHARRQALPAERLGGAAVRGDVGLWRRPPHAVLALRASGDG